MGDACRPVVALLYRGKVGPSSFLEFPILIRLRGRFKHRELVANTSKTVLSGDKQCLFHLKRLG